MYRLLVAEDEDVLRLLIIDSLEDESFIIDEACDGTEALELILQNDYDLLIIDFMMPVMTGIELMRNVRSHKDKCSTKILMLSAKSMKHDIEKIMQAGADVFMSKPFSPTELVKQVSLMIGSGRDRK